MVCDIERKKIMLVPFNLNRETAVYYYHMRTIDDGSLFLLTYLSRIKLQILWDFQIVIYVTWKISQNKLRKKEYYGREFIFFHGIILKPLMSE